MNEKAEFQGILNVIQEDRDEAADYIVQQDINRPFENTFTKAMREGRHDSHPLVQAFARHRIKTLQQSVDLEILPELKNLVERAREVEGESDGGNDVYFAWQRVSNFCRENIDLIIYGLNNNCREKVLEEVIGIKPEKSETFSYQAAGYAEGWMACENAFRKSLKEL